MATKSARASNQSEQGNTPLWHALTPDAVLAILDTSLVGLAPDEAALRLQKNGPNILAFEKKETWWKEVFESLTEPLQLLLVAVGVLYALFGRFEDAITIFVVIVLLSVIEAINEFRAKKAISSLHSLTDPHTVVRRGGSIREIPSSEVVAGDVVMLRSGSRVTADLRLLDSTALRVDESSITGESVPVEKRSNVVLAPDTALADRVNLAYSGTSVTGGFGRGIVVATGPATELGRIAALARTAREKRTPLQQQMNELARWLLWVALGLSALIPTLGVLIAKQPVREMLLSGLTLAFAIIPEELPILVTVVLGLGAYRLAQQHAIARRLEAVEALGSITVVGTDKTGTLTENEMQVAEFYVDGTVEPSSSRQPDAQRLLQIGSIANEAQAGVTDVNGGFAGDATDIALLAAARESGVGASGLTSGVRVLKRIPFDVSLGRTSAIYERDGACFVATKGSPEVVVKLSAKVRRADGVRPLDQLGRDAILAQANEFAAHGFRVLAFAERKLPKNSSPETPDVDAGLTLVGLAALQDPPRPEAAPTVATLQGAGIRVIMITGDHPATAIAIAKQVGIDADRVLASPEILATRDDALAPIVRSVSLFARVTPEHKLRIVRALQSQGEVVAVTGDGVNDAPALREATIGVAMGRRGTDVAREAADVVLADDNFATLAVAVRGGRILYENLRKAVCFYLAAKLALVVSTLGTVLATLPLPFGPVQMIILEGFMDLGASSSFAVEPPEEDVMTRPPRNVRRPLMDRSMVTGLLGGGLSLAIAVVISYIWVLHHGISIEAARTSAFTTWMVGHVWLAAHMRSERQPLLAGGLRFTWPFAVWTLAAILLATLGPVAPFVSQRLSLVPLSRSECGIALLCALVSPSWLEAVKWARWRRHDHPHAPRPETLSQGLG
jgi:P-type Ca2+ transporter type 2C